MSEFKPSFVPPNAVNLEWLAGRIATLLGYYFQEDDADAIIEAQAGDWLDILGHYPQAAIESACRAYLMDEPRRKPTPGALRALCLKHLEREALVNRVALAPPPEPERVRCSPEAAARILAEAGLTPQRLAAIAHGRRMPPPMQPGYEEPEPAPPMTAEEAAARPYTDAERARMARLRPQPQEETTHG